jgi:hypothetical protein
MTKVITVESSIGIVRHLKCIIVTDAFGSEMDPDVLQIRSFRDIKVMSTFTGKNFVQLFHLWYYIWSPPAAEIISGNEALRGFMRILLTPLVYTMRASEKVYDSLYWAPEIASMISILKCCSSLRSLLSHTNNPTYRQPRIKT